MSGAPGRAPAPLPRRVGVVGAGVMGAGIAQVLATAGIPAACHDRDAAALARARRRIEEGRYGLRASVAAGRLSPEEAEAIRDRLSFTGELDEVAAADLVIECVPEALDLKIRVFRELDRWAPPEAVLASNTSGFPVAALAPATDRPERVLVWHWASPAVVMRFAEVVVRPETDPDAVARVVATARHCGRRPVVVRDQPTAWGFVANRIYAAMLREARRVVEEGVAEPGQIDQLLVDCFRWPVGPFGMARGAARGFEAGEGGDDADGR